MRTCSFASWLTSASAAVLVVGSALAQNDALAPGEVTRDTLGNGELGPEMVILPAGQFLIGSPDDEPGRRDLEGPQTQIMFARPFAMGRYELTWNEWEACVAAGGCEDNSDKAYATNPGPDAWTGDAGYGRGTRPVINVSFADAEDYVRWLSAETGHTYRLPSEAEWEYAARAGTTGRFSWGDVDPTCEPGQENTANFSGPNTGMLEGCLGRRTSPVGYSAPNPFGLYDMHGNVREWVVDCFHVSFEGIPTDGSAWLTDCARGGEGNVFRGGSFTAGAAQLRSASRQATTRREVNMGFRIVRELE